MGRTMPKNKKQLESMLEHAFLSGCGWGYAVEHTVNISAQEQVGADVYLGRISTEDGYQELRKLQEG